MHKSTMSMWPTLLRIVGPLQTVYGVLTMPFSSKLKAKIVIRMPTRRFYFRPLYFQDVCMAFGMWEPYVRKAITSVLKRGSVFIDVGAHIGYHTVLASEIVGSDGLVIAVEPDERNCRVLTRNCRPKKGVIIYQAAASAKSGSMRMKCWQDKDYQDVNCITLDSLTALVTSKKRPMVLVKIDVEGAELEVLKGGLKLIEAVHPTLIIEGGGTSEIRGLLEPFGYEYSRLFTSYSLFRVRSAKNMEE